MTARPGEGVLTHDPLAAVPGLVHGALSRAVVDGVPWGSWCGDLGFAAFVTPRQVHGAAVQRVEAPWAGPAPPCDALVTDRPGLLLGVLGADCPGVLLVDAARGALGVVHSGWRGTAAAVVVKTLERMATAYGTQPADVEAWIGPGISGPCYEVDDTVLRAMGPTVPAAALARAVRPTRPGHARLDLATILEAQLLQAGVPAPSVARSRVCTYTDPTWHSHRRDGARAGRHVLVAGWRTPA